MTVLRLKKLGSYDGYGIKATAGNPLVQVDEEIARKLLATGYFSLEGPGGEATDADIPEPQDGAESSPGDVPEETKEEAETAEGDMTEASATKKKGGK